MNNVVAINNRTSWSDQQFKLMKRTVAKDCNVEEFDQFCHVAAHVNLDPLRRQIYAFVFNKDRADKRSMAIVTAIAGLRTIADRTANYRPDDEPPRFVTSKDAVNPKTNPAGLVSAEVSVFKFAHGEWFKTVGIALWDEFAPISDEWAYDPEKEKRAPTGNKTLDGKWQKMPNHMLAKCAESQALRRAWPDEMANVYEESEMDLARTLDLTPSEWVERAAVEDRLSLIGGADAITFEFGDGMERIALGKVGDRIAQHLKALKPFEVVQWQNVNSHSLKEFWARSKSDALEVKKLTDAAQVKVNAEQETA